MVQGVGRRIGPHVVCQVRSLTHRTEVPAHTSILVQELVNTIERGIDLQAERYLPGDLRQ